jgi:hypothetical protein
MFVAGANGCPISNPGPIEAYLTAASHFHSTFGRPYQHMDGRAGELMEACQLLVTHKVFLDECHGDVEKEHRLLGQKEFLLTFVNPFPSHDPERARLDATSMSNVLSYVVPSDSRSIQSESGWWHSGPVSPCPRLSTNLRLHSDSSTTVGNNLAASGATRRIADVHGIFVLCVDSY